MSRTVILIAALVLGCAPDGRAIELDGLDLTDMEVVQKVRGQLSADDGAAFASYVVKHNARSASFCGRPLTGSGGQPPATVGEAIDLTLVRDAEDRRARQQAGRSRDPGELAKQKWDDLIFERDALIDAQSLLLERDGGASKRSAEWKALESRKRDLDKRLAEMKPSVFASE